MVVDRLTIDNYRAPNGLPIRLGFFFTKKVALPTPLLIKPLKVNLMNTISDTYIITYRRFTRTIMYRNAYFAFNHKL